MGNKFGFFMYGGGIHIIHTSKAVPSGLLRLPLLFVTTRLIGVAVVYQRLTRTIEELTKKTKRMEFTIDKIKQVEQYEKKHPHEISAPEPAVPEGTDLSQDDDAWFRQWLSSEGGSEF